MVDPEVFSSAPVSVAQEGALVPVDPGHQEVQRPAPLVSEASRAVQGEALAGLVRQVVALEPARVVANPV